MNSDTPRDVSPGVEGDTRPSEGWIGRVVDDRYRVVDELGEGGMGWVFVAEHLKLHKQVALKVIHPEFAGDGEIAARFAREAMASAQLDHPHVASALDYGTLPEGGAYLVMQLVRGRSLQQHLDEQGRMDWRLACDVGAQVADALSAAHASGIVHRDLKPDNVLLVAREDGSSLVKVLDFGIARVAMEDRAAPDGAAPTKMLTRVGTVMGTPGYMAPEQAMGEQVDARADLYALGVVLWELIAGRSLFDSQDLTQIVTRQLTEPAPPLREAAGDATIPPALEDLTAAMLAPKPDQRPASASFVRDTLRQAIHVAAPASGTHPVLPGGGAPGEPGPVPPRPTTAHPATTALPPAVTEIVSKVQTRLPPSVTRVATRVRERVPLPVIGLGCALPLLAAMGLVFVIALSGGSDEEGEAKEPASGSPSFDVSKLLRPIRENLGPTVPPEVQERIDGLSERRRRDRREAAEWLEDHEPQSEVPEFALALAELELARGCRNKEDALARVVEIGDERALPTVERMHDTPRRGCGLLRLSDCYSCMRSDLEDAVEALGGPSDDEPAREQTKRAR